MNRNVLYIVFILTLITSFSASQDLLNQERIPVTNPGIYTDWSMGAVNGKGEIGLFTLWYGGSKAPDGIIFRKLDKEGKPLGPQKMVFELDTPQTNRSYIQKVVYAENHYFVTVFDATQNEVMFFKFTENGHLVTKVIYNYGLRGNSMSRFLSATIFGDSIYYHQTTSEGFIYRGADGDVPGEKGDRQTENFLLKLNINNPEELEKIELVNPTDDYLVCCGVDADTDKIVALFATKSRGDDDELVNPFMVSYDPLSKKVSKPVKIEIPFELQNRYYITQPPVYNGKGFLFYYKNTSNNYFSNYSFLFDNNGKTLIGPTDFKENGTFFDPFNTHLVGSFVLLNCFDDDLDAVKAILLGRKGRHARSIYYEENRDDDMDFIISSIEHVFTGNNLVFLYTGSTPESLRTYSKSCPTPKPIKDGIAFFQAGSQNFDDGSRRLIWSIVGSESVTIKHGGKEYKNLPAKYSFQLPTAESKDVVELTFTSAAGKTYSRKIRLK